MVLGLVGLVVAPAALPAGATRVSATAKESGGTWTTYGGSSTRTSNQPISPSLDTIVPRWTTTGLAGAIYGEPLISGRTVYVATESDMVYALVAGSGRVIWSRSIGAPVPAGDLPCGDISPTVGVTSTMVLDPVTGRLFVSGSVLSGGGIHHILDAIAPGSGRILLSRDLDRPGWTAAAELQRNALGLDGDRVLVGFGGNDGDCGPYNGYLMGVPTTGSAPIAVFRVATSREGAIWAPSGVAVDGSGDIYLATGNGSSLSTIDEGDSVIELNADLQQISSFTPTNWREDNADDGDLGSTSPVLVARHRVFIVGKEATGYLLRQGALGGLGGQIASAQICFSIGGSAYAASVLYLACPRNGVTAVRIAGSTLQPLWQAPSGDGASPTIAGGRIWTIDAGRLVGLFPASGAVAESVATIATEHFAAPSAGDGLLVVGGASGVEAFEGPAGYTP